jgi:hypothetical protein
MRLHCAKVVIAATLSGFVAWASADAEQGMVAVHAGQVAAILGSMHVERLGGEMPLRVGDPLFVGDRLRTQTGDRAKIVLADDAVIDIGSDTELLIESRHTEADTGEGESVLILVTGRLRAIAPPGSGAVRRFEVESPAAVAFRGGDFVVSYDTAADTSQIVAIDGNVSVAGKLGVVGGVVDVEPGFGTEVRKGRLPAPPQEAGAADIERLVQSTAMLGTGRRDGLEVLHPALSGRLLAATDTPGLRARRMAQGLRLGTPGEFLAERLSADVRTNTQPLLEYKRRDPGRPSATGVEVEF